MIVSSTRGISACGERYMIHVGVRNDKVMDKSIQKALKSWRRAVTLRSSSEERLGREHAETYVPNESLPVDWHIFENGC